MSPKNKSISKPSLVKWLNTIVVAELCVALFQYKSPAAGVPVVIVVSAV
jgi:hypothetical protein